MTITQRTTIDPKDIVAIEYTCTRCAARHTVPLKSFDSVIEICPNCREELVSDKHKVSDRPTDAGILYHFVEKLRMLAESGIPIGLEIASRQPPTIQK